MDGDGGSAASGVLGDGARAYGEVGGVRGNGGAQLAVVTRTEPEAAEEEGQGQGATIAGATAVDKALLRCQPARDALQRLEQLRQRRQLRRERRGRARRRARAAGATGERSEGVVQAVVAALYCDDGWPFPWLRERRDVMRPAFCSRAASLGVGSRE